MCWRSNGRYESESRKRRDDHDSMRQYASDGAKENNENSHHMVHRYNQVNACTYCKLETRPESNENGNKSNKFLLV